MRIGFDLDGVLAGFDHRFAAILTRLSGQRIVPPTDYFTSGAPCWDWWTPLGYSNAEVHAAWEEVNHSPSFWYSLMPTAEMDTLITCIEDLEHKHDVYFITNRQRGVNPKRQTEAWLKRYLPYDKDVQPTVLLIADKGTAAKALRLDWYIDDHLANALSVLREAPKTRMYLYNRRHNVGDASIDVPTTGSVFGPVETRTATRVTTLAEMLTLELSNL